MVEMLRLSGISAISSHVVYSRKRAMGRHRITIRAVCVTLVALMLGWAGLAMADTHYRYATVDGRKLFYREAGDASKPSILLLHGFPFPRICFAI
jgi:hypothetical protein